MNGLVTIQDIYHASNIIAGKVHRTSMHSCETIGKLYKIDLYFKMELFQKTGSFKPRGVLNKLNALSTEEKNRGVVSLSAGNHAQALSWGASRENIRSTIFMPALSDKSKIKATESYGGRVMLTDGNLLEECLAFAEQENLTVLHPFDDLEVIAGQGTVGLEIVEDLDDFDTVVVSVGGGGLISGVATAIKNLKPNVRIIGVEPLGSNVITRSLEADKPITMDDRNTIADGLNAPFAGVHTLKHIQTYVDEMVNVSEEEIIIAIGLIMERVKVVPEPAASAALAAIQSGRLKTKPGEKVVVVLCGGNISLENLKRFI